MLSLYTGSIFESPGASRILIYNRVVKKILRFRLSLLFWYLFGTVLLLLATASCASLPVDRPWVYADLRALDTLDAPSPATDILAVYTRTTDLSVDIRVDLLDINPADKYTLKLALWDNRDFSQNPLMIDISSTGIVQTSGIHEGKPVIWPRVVQSHQLDTITMNLNRSFIGERYRLDVSTYTTDPVSLADEIHNIRSDSQPPVNRAPILVAFWDAFPVTTPAQALRSWDGAHTGPLGDRHGLLHILAGAGQYNVPVALLDIKNPASLAVLNFMGDVPKLKDLYARGLLILPDVAYGKPADVALDFSRRATTGFGLPASQFVYATSSDPSVLAVLSNQGQAGVVLAQAGLARIPGYHARFLPLADSAHLENFGGTRFIPIPSPDVVEATEDGPSLDVRRALIGAALSPDPTDLVVLGGSLPRTTWGDSDMAYPTFEWIATHPWIHPLAGQDLLTFPTQTQQFISPTTAIKHPWLEDLQSAPQNAVTQSAWQTYLTLTAFTADKQLQDLHSVYLGQVGELLAAANWAKNRTRRADCTDDLNGDGHVECILANQKYFAVLEPGGARLMQFFYFDANGPHQLVGPSSQFAVGLSDPSEWHPERGEAADPSVIPGAFADDTNTWTDYSPTITADGITFTGSQGSRIKTYRLTENGIQVIYRVQGPVSTRIPLALDPQAFYSGPTNYLATLASHSWTWILAGGSGVEVRTDAVLSAEGFTSALPFLSLPEDPNLEYPKGNYLPFPLSVVTIQGDGNFSVQIIQK
jgi:hypothetical protein